MIKKTVKTGDNEIILEFETVEQLIQYEEYHDVELQEVMNLSQDDERFYELSEIYRNNIKK